MIMPKKAVKNALTTVMALGSTTSPCLYCPLGIPTNACAAADTFWNS